MTNPFAGLEIRVEPPDTGPVIAAQQAALAAFWAADAAVRAANTAVWAAYDAGLDIVPACRASLAAADLLRATMHAMGVEPPAPPVPPGAVD